MMLTYIDNIPHSCSTGRYKYLFNDYLVA